MPKDACYRKVKAKFKVFPSAYAGGAIAKCRKVGAANYGTGGKKKAKKKAEGGVVKMAGGGSIKDYSDYQDLIDDQIAKDLKDLKKINFKRGAKFSVDSKGNVTKNFKNGGNVTKQKRKRPAKNKNIARGCGIVMENRRKVTKYR